MNRTRLWPLAALLGVLLLVPLACSEDETMPGATPPPPSATITEMEGVPNSLAAAAGDLHSGPYRVRASLGGGLGARDPSLTSGAYEVHARVVKRPPKP
jgi:hypothetical protein